MVHSSLKDEPKTKNPKINANNEEKKCFKHFRLKTHIKLKNFNHAHYFIGYQNIIYSSKNGFPLHF